jgi:dephospho-CoA kinase
MIRLGLTGGIASGKTTVCRLFARHAIPIFDADATVHRLYTTHRVVAWFTEHFPETVCEGKVHRPSLSRLIQTHPDVLSNVEAYMHPLVWQEEQDFWKYHIRHATAITLSDIPLLMEARREGEYDAVIALTAPLWLRKQRACKRHGMNAEKFARIAAKQLLEYARCQRADIMIPTSAGKAETARIVHHFIKSIYAKTDCL